MERLADITLFDFPKLKDSSSINEFKTLKNATYESSSNLTTK